MLFQRATQTYLWALPLINTLGMKFGSEKVFGAGYNVLPVWKKRLDAKTLVTTPNSDVIYAMNYLDVGKDGPMVMEAPAGLQGILMDFWQRPIPGPTIDGHTFAGDVGLPGPDGGKGGKFLILPPGYDKPVPEGYFVYRSGTNNVFVFLRSFYQDPKNLAPAVAVMEAVKIYPLGASANASRCNTPMRRAYRRTCCLSPTAARSIRSRRWSTLKVRTSLIPTGWACLRRSASPKVSPSTPTPNAGHSRSRGEDRLQNQPRDRFRGGRERAKFPHVPEPPMGQSPCPRHGHRYVVA